MAANTKQIKADIDSLIKSINNADALQDSNEKYFTIYRDIELIKGHLNTFNTANSSLRGKSLSIANNYVKSINEFIKNKKFSINTEISRLCSSIPDSIYDELKKEYNEYKKSHGF